MNFPVTPGAFQTRFGGTGALGQGDAFAAKVRADGSLVWSTFLGGSRGEIAAGIDVDSSGNAYISGLTESADFPITAGSFQPQYAGGPADGFLTKLDPEGRRLIYSTFLGGQDGDEECFSVAVDARGQAHVAGSTFSRTFPTVDPYQAAFRGPLTDAFVAKFDSAGSKLHYSTFLGGNGNEIALRIAVGNGGNACVAGFSTASDFPTTPSALQTANRGGGDAFVACITHYEPGEEEETRIIPVVGSTAGSHGSFFRTSFQLHNPAESTIAGRLLYRSAGSGETAAILPYMLGARQTLSFENLMDVLGMTGVGSADLSFEPGQEPVTLVRIFQDGGEAGTSGMSSIPLPLHAALRPGQEGILIAPPDPGSARMNIGLRALGDGAAIRLVRRSAAGSVLGAIDRELEPNVFLQAAASTLFGDDLEESESLTVTVSRGAAIVYGATNDNRTNDPSLQFAAPVAGVEGETRIAPVVGSLRGAFGSNFKTSAQLHNPTDAEVEGRILLRTADGSRETSLSYLLSPRATVSWEDLPSFMDVTGLATLEIRPERGMPPIARLRIYNDLEEDGTLGMSIDTLTEAEAIMAGTRAILIAPPDPVRARFNIGIAALEALEIEVVVRDLAGTVVRQTVVTIPARSLVQRDAGSLLGAQIAGSDVIEMHVRSGRAFIYGATNDNTTNDPSLQLARRVE
ncbi:MAG TPA: SBBP repeat-containing protein [Thermoanaerobaculia bacterium]|nr:SBBP repeat-containing protein [Thermoanaerobaculia bacterium]